MKKCTNCDNTEFYAIELVRAWAIVNGNGEIIKDAEKIEECRIEQENWECTKCGTII